MASRANFARGGAWFRELEAISALIALGLMLWPKARANVDARDSG
jgi:hypothetical protein